RHPATQRLRLDAQRTGTLRLQRVQAGRDGGHCRLLDRDAVGEAPDQTELRRTPVAERVEAHGPRDPLHHIGTHTSAGCSIAVPTNPGGATPTTTKPWPVSTMVRPMIPGSPPNRRCQSSWPITATACAPGTRFSSGRNARPRTGMAPRTRK